MTVNELIQYLQSFHDKEAIVEVLVHTRGTTEYDQGGWCNTVEFDPETHTEYTSFINNRFAYGQSFANKTYLLLGKKD